jgi:hypothetical protein
MGEGDLSHQKLLSLFGKKGVAKLMWAAVCRLS